MLLKPDCIPCVLNMSIPPQGSTLKPRSAVSAQVTDEVDDIDQKRHCVHCYQSEKPAVKKRASRAHGFHMQVSLK